LVATPGYGTGAIVEVVALSLPVLLAEEFLEDVLALPGDGGPLGLSKRVWISTLTAGAGSNASKVKFGRSCDCWVVTRWVLFGIR
jgi:hypothetical protein